MGFSVTNNIGSQYVMQSDNSKGKENLPGCQQDGKVSKNEMMMELAQTFDSFQAAKPDSQEKGDLLAKGQLLNTILKGNEGQGFFDKIANLVTKDGQIDKKDMEALAAKDGDASSLSQADFEALKSQKLDING